MKGLRPRIGLAVAGVVALAFLYYGNRAEPVVAYRIETEPVSQVLRATGKVLAGKKVTIRSEVTGQIKQVGVAEGDRVESGQSLTQINDSDVQYRYQQAKAQLAAILARARYSAETLVPLARENLQQIADSTAQQQQLCEHNAILFGEGAISQQELDQGQDRLRALQSQYRVAELNLQAQVEGGGQNSEMTALVEQARISLNQAENEVRKYRIAAPFAGIITELDLTIGQSIRTGDAVATLVDEGSYYLALDVDEKYLGLLAPGQAATIWIDAYPNREFSGQVAWIGPRVEPETGTVRIRVDSDSARSYLRQDMTVQTEIKVREQSEALILDASALVGRNPFRVLTLEEGKAVVREFSGESMDNSQVLVNQGLAPGTVILDPAAAVRAGDPVPAVKLQSEGF